MHVWLKLVGQSQSKAHYLIGVDRQLLLHDTVCGDGDGDG
jgi:hypothetical protein